jgi:hypothetical protein
MARGIFICARQCGTLDHAALRAFNRVLMSAPLSIVDGARTFLSAAVVATFPVSTTVWSGPNHVALQRTGISVLRQRVRG